MEEKIYKVDLIQVLIFSIITFALLVFAMVCLIRGNIFFMFLGLIITLVVLYMVMSALRKQSFSMDILTLDEYGFMDNSTENSVGFVPWEAVEGIASVDAGSKYKKPIISVKIKETYLDKLDIDIEELSTLDDKMRFGEVNISLQLIFESDVEVLSTMTSYLDEYKKGKE